MEYLPIKDISTKFAMPLRTVYYNLDNKRWIRSKKEGRKRLIHVADFANHCNLNLQNKSNDEQKTQSEKQIANVQDALQNLQWEYETVKKQNFNLQKFNSNLNDQVNKYALLLTEEKTERKELLEKYDTLQVSYRKKVEQFSRKYFLVVGMCIILFIAVVIILIFPYLVNFQN